MKKKKKKLRQQEVGNRVGHHWFVGVTELLWVQFRLRLNDNLWCHNSVKSRCRLLLSHPLNMGKGKGVFLLLLFILTFYY